MGPHPQRPGAIDIVLPVVHEERRFSPEIEALQRQSINSGIGLGEAHFTRHQHITEMRSEEHTSELQSLMRISYAVFCLKKNNKTTTPRSYITLYSIYYNTPIYTYTVQQHPLR